MSSSASELGSISRPSNIFKANNGKHKVSAITFLEKNKYIITCSGEDYLQVIDAKTGDFVGNICRDPKDRSQICAFTISPDGKFVTTGSKDGRVRLWTWKGRTAELVRKSADHIAAVNCLRWSPPDVGNAHIASGFDDGSVTVWTLKLEKFVHTDETRLRHIYSIDYSHDGTQLIASGYDSKFSVLRINSRTREIKLVSVSGVCSNPHQVQRVTWARKTDGYSIVTGSTDGKIRVRPSGESIELEVEGHSGLVSAVVASPDNRILASVSDDCTLRLWDLDAMRSIGPPLQHDTGLSCAAFAAGGALLATGTDDGMIHVWEISLLTAEPVPNEASVKVVVKVLSDELTTTTIPRTPHPSLKTEPPQLPQGFFETTPSPPPPPPPEPKASPQRTRTLFGAFSFLFYSRPDEERLSSVIEVPVPVINPSKAGNDTSRAWQFSTKVSGTLVAAARRTKLLRVSHPRTNDRRSRSTSTAEEIPEQTRSGSEHSLRIKQTFLSNMLLHVGCIAKPD